MRKHQGWGTSPGCVARLKRGHGRTVGAGLLGWLFFSCALPLVALGGTLRPGDFVVLSPPGFGARLVALDGTSAAASELVSGGLLSGGTDLVVGASGEILVVVPATGIVRVSPGSGAQSILAPIGTLGDGQPSGITVGLGGSIFVSLQSASPRIVELSSSGEFIRVVSGGGLLQMPAGLAFGNDGALYVCETIPYPVSAGGGIVRVDPTSGAQSAVAGGVPLIGPFHIAAAPDGTLWTVQFGSLSQRRSACVVRTRVADGYSESMPAFECTAYGIAIRSDGTTVVGECARIHGDCGGSADLYTVMHPSGSIVWGVSGPVSVVPEGLTPSRRQTWGHLKAIYK